MNKTNLAKTITNTSESCFLLVAWSHETNRDRNKLLTQLFLPSERSFLLACKLMRLSTSSMSLKSGSVEPWKVCNSNDLYERNRQRIAKRFALYFLVTRRGWHCHVQTVVWGNGLRPQWKTEDMCPWAMISLGESITHPLSSAAVSMKWGTGKCR